MKGVGGASDERCGRGQGWRVWEGPDQSLIYIY